MAYKPITVSSVANFPAGQESYTLVVQFLDNSNNLIVDPNVIQNQSFTKGNLNTPFDLHLYFPAGNYTVNAKVRVLYNGQNLSTSNLTAITFECSDDSPEPPESLVKLGITRENTSRDTTLYVQSTEPIQIRISAIDPPQPVGKDHALATWDNTTWQSGDPDTTWVPSPYTKFYRFNPSSVGVGGLIGGKKYLIHIRETADPSNVYSFEYTMPNTDLLGTPTEITIATGCSKTGLADLSWFGPYVSHSAAQDAACLNTGTGGIGRISIDLTTSTTAYANTLLGDCSVLANGYYWLKNGGTRLSSTIQVTSGLIAGTSSFSCTPPSPGAEPVGVDIQENGGKRLYSQSDLGLRLELTSAGKVKVLSASSMSTVNGNNTGTRYPILNQQELISIADGSPKPDAYGNDIYDDLFGDDGLDFETGRQHTLKMCYIYQFGLPVWINPDTGQGQYGDNNASRWMFTRFYIEDI